MNVSAIGSQNQNLNFKAKIQGEEVLDLIERMPKGLKKEKALDAIELIRMENPKETVLLDFTKIGTDWDENPIYGSVAKTSSGKEIINTDRIKSVADFVISVAKKFTGKDV